MYFTVQLEKLLRYDVRYLPTGPEKLTETTSQSGTNFVTSEYLKLKKFRFEDDYLRIEAGSDTVDCYILTRSMINEGRQLIFF